MITDNVDGEYQGTGRKLSHKMEVTNLTATVTVNRKIGFPINRKNRGFPMTLIFYYANDNCTVPESKVCNLVLGLRYFV